jgi:hypothetical protein
MQDQGSPLLFITGSAGCGKSCLARYILDYLDQVAGCGDNNKVLPFFCNVAAATSQREPPILDYWVRSLIEWKPCLFQSINTRYKSHNPKSPRLSLGSLIEILRSITLISDSGSLFLLIDGLDECEASYIRQLLQGIQRILEGRTRADTSGTRGLKVVISCRPNLDILPSTLGSLRIDIIPKDVELDISYFVDLNIGRISSIKGLEGWKPGELAETVKRHADGFFFWAYNIIRAIETSGRVGRGNIQQIINSCPHDIGKYFDEQLDALPEVSSSDGVVRTALKLIIIAQYPLSIKELLDAASFMGK